MNTGRVLLRYGTLPNGSQEGAIFADTLNKVVCKFNILSWFGENDPELFVSRLKQAECAVVRTVNHLNVFSS